MKEAENRNLTIYSNPKIIKSLQGAMHNKNLSGRKKLEDACLHLDGLSAEIISARKTIEKQLNPDDARLEKWWQGNKPGFINAEIRKYWMEEGDLGMIVRVRGVSAAAYCIEVKEVVSRLQELYPKNRPEDFRETIEKAEKKRRKKGFLFDMEDSPIEELKRGIVPATLEKDGERLSITGEFHEYWLLTGKSGKEYSICEMRGRALVINGKVGKGDLDKIKRLTVEIEDRRKRSQRCQQKITMLDAIFDKIAHSSFPVSEEQVKKLINEINQSLGETGRISVEKADKSPCCLIHVIVKNGSPPRVKKRTLYNRSLLLAFIAGSLAVYFSHAFLPAKDVPREFPRRETKKRLPKTDADRYFQNATVCLEQRLYRQAIEKFTIALELSPHWALAHFCRGKAYYCQEKYKESIEDFDKALEINPRLSQIHGKRAIALVETGQYERAGADFDKVIEENPSFANYANRGDCRVKQKRYRLAIEDFDLALKLNANLPQVYVNRGVAHYRLKQYSLALKDFSSALQRGVKTDILYINRARVFMEMRDYDRAIDDYTQTLKVNPLFLQAYTERGIAYARKEDYPQAIADFDSALARDSRLARAYVGRGMAYFELGDYKKTIENFNAAQKLTPDFTREFELYIERARQRERKK